MSDKRIKEAFEQMNPTPEAEDRMLANILAAAETPEEAPSSYKHAKRISPWKVALPIAASLVLLAGLGIFAVSSLDNSNESATTMVMEAASSGSAADPSDSAAEEESSEAAPESSDSEPHDNAAPAPKASESAGAEKSIGTDESADAESSADLAVAYPYIEDPEDGTWFATRTDSRGGIQADPGLLGPELGPATAWNADLTESIACTLYDCPTTAIPYLIVQYEGDDSYYLVVGFGIEKP